MTPVMITSWEVLESACSAAGLGISVLAYAQAQACVVEPLAFDQIEMPVGTAHQDRHPIGLGIAIDHVVLRNFHFEHRLFQGHGLIPAAIVHAKDLLISTLFSGERKLFSGLSVS